MSRTPFGTQTERRSTARRNASQTRPDQTRVLLTAVGGVSISNSIHRQGSRGTISRRMDGRSAAEFGGGC